MSSGKNIHIYRLCILHYSNNILNSLPLPWSSTQISPCVNQIFFNNYFTFTLTILLHPFTSQIYILCTSCRCLMRTFLLMAVWRIDLVYSYYEFHNSPEARGAELLGRLGRWSFTSQWPSMHHSFVSSSASSQASCLAPPQLPYGITLF